MPNACWLGLLIAALSGFSASASIAPELYSEYVTLDESRGSAADATGRLLWKTSSSLIPYATFSYLRYSAEGKTISRSSPGLGLRWQPLPFLRAFGEYRRAHDSPGSRRKKDDPRLGLVAFFWKDIAPLGKHFRLANDSYGEFIWMNRYSNSPMAAAWSKLLLRSNPTPTTFADSYLEIYALESRDPILGRRARELRGGLRAGWVGTKFSFTGQAFRRLASTVDAPRARYRFLFALGASF